MSTIISVGPNVQYQFSTTDASRTLAHLGRFWHGLVDGLDPDVVDTSGVTVIGAEVVDAITDALGVDYPDTPTIAEALTVLGARAGESVDGGADADTAAAWLSASWVRLLDASERLRPAGAYPTQEGTIERVNSSGGGAPKVAVDGAVDVTWAGLTGDVQGNRKHHGRPWQALSIWSGDVIDDLRAEGHPLEAGLAGENLTVRGIDWSLVRPGTRFTLGSSQSIVSGWADPCRKIGAGFIDNNFSRIDDRSGVARAYATVVVPGTVSAGDVAAID